MAEDEKKVVTIPLDEQNNLVFGVEIKGITTSDISPSFVIESDGMNIEIPGVYDNGEVTIDVPILNKYLDENLYNGKLELVIEGERIFTPLDLNVELYKSIEVEANVVDEGIKENQHKDKKSSGKKQKSDSKSSDKSKPEITATVVESNPKPKQSEKELIGENIDDLIKAKNSNQLLYEYSNKVLQREKYIPINIKDILPKLNEVSQELYGKNFKEIIKEHNSN